MLKPVYLTEDDAVAIIDQRRLPLEVVWLKLRAVSEVAEAIKTLAVRGAPAIGIAAAYGVYIAVKDFTEGYDAFYERFRKAKKLLASTRPTAVNLFWALDRMERVLKENPLLPVHKLVKKLRAEAVKIQEEDLESCIRMGELGAELLPDGARVLTHCNAGALATGGYGTALGVVRKGYEKGRVELVWVDETRPLLQGARLTAWEMEYEGIPYKVITDNMAGFLMSKGMVDVVIVGADRIAANGDTANKIGTYSLAVLARHHRIPFIVAAPVSTFDLSLSRGADIPIEERNELEVLEFRGVRVTPKGAKAYNPAFDVTPSELISFIVTEKGVIEPPFSKNIEALLRNEDKV